MIGYTVGMKSGGRWWVFLQICIVVVCLILAGALLFPYQITVAYEDISYSLFPSPERAYVYGNRHLDASNPREYNVNRAYYFLELAALQDASLPYLYHQLARISFLRGNYQIALAQINFQISLHGDSEPNAYYVRALIEGFEGNYSNAIVDYQHFLQFDPHDWAGINDYAWVLLKANRPQDAAVITQQGLSYFPDNAWLLNTNAIALYETGDIKDASTQAARAVEAGEKLTVTDWLHAYPGNDPQVASQGLATFQQAAQNNMHTIALALASSTVQSK